MGCCMLDKSSINIEEKLFNSYISMRRSMLDFDNFKYENLDKYINSADFKSGFFAGVRVMFSLFLDNND